MPFKEDMDDFLLCKTGDCIGEGMLDDGSAGMTRDTITLTFSAGCRTNNIKKPSGLVIQVIPGDTCVALVPTQSVTQAAVRYLSVPLCDYLTLTTRVRLLGSTTWDSQRKPPSSRVPNTFTPGIGLGIRVPRGLPWD